MYFSPSARCSRRASNAVSSVFSLSGSSILVFPAAYDAAISSGNRLPRSAMLTDTPKQGWWFLWWFSLFFLPSVFFVYTLLRYILCILFVSIINAPFCEYQWVCMKRSLSVMFRCVYENRSYWVWFPVIRHEGTGSFRYVFFILPVRLVKQQQEQSAPFFGAGVLVVFHVSLLFYCAGTFSVAFWEINASLNKSIDKSVKMMYFISEKIFDRSDARCAGDCGRCFGWAALALVKNSGCFSFARAVE